MLLMLRIRSGGKRGKSVFFDKKRKTGGLSILNDTGETGCIPSKVRVERKEKLRMKQVKFNPRPDDQGQVQQSGAAVTERSSRLRLSSKFPFMKSRDNIMKEELSESSDSDFELADDWVLSYEPVHMVRKR